jgi:hypothetical protein
LAREKFFFTLSPFDPAIGGTQDMPFDKLRTGKERQDSPRGLLGGLGSILPFIFDKTKTIPLSFSCSAFAGFESQILSGL